MYEENIMNDRYLVNINGFDLNINLNDDSIIYNTISLNCDRTNKFILSDLYNYDIKINNIRTYKKIINIRLDTINSKEKLILSIKRKDELHFKEYTINTLPTDFPKYTVKGKSPYMGDYYFTSFVTSSIYYIFKMNNQGEILFYRGTPYSPALFKKVINGSKTRYIYTEWTNRPIKNEPLRSSSFTANIVLLNENYIEIDRIGSIINGSEIAPYDVYYIDDRNYIITSYVPKTVYNMPSSLNLDNNQSNVIAAVVAGIKNNKIIWKWDSTDYPELYLLSEYGNEYNNKNDFYADYAHINSIYKDNSDSSIIISLRNLSAVLKIDINKGKIIWILGGNNDQFGLTVDEKFCRQSNASYLKDGSILLFDNGVSREHSRIVRIKIDEINKKLISYDSYSINDRYSVIMGSAQLLDYYKDVYLIGWGGIIRGDTTVTEYDFKNKKVLFEFTFHKKSKILGPMMYRAYKSI